MQKKGKLELTWVGKYEEKVVEPRILVKDKSKSYGDPDTGNMLIHGDNLIALKALEQDFAGKIKCIYIDPPYNTGSAFEHYDDGLEHSIWLSMMYERLKLLKILLREDGLIFIQIDDNEHAYLKVMCDEIFGRENFITTICVKMSTASGVKTSHRDKTIIKEKELILTYCRRKDKCRINPQYIPVKDWDYEFQYYLNRNDSDNPENWQVERLADVLKRNNLVFDLNDAKTLKFIENNRKNIWRRAFIRNQYKSLSQKEPNKVFYVKKDQVEHYYYRGREMFFLEDKFHRCFTENGYSYQMSNLLCDFWQDVNTGKLFNEGGIEFRNSKKPELLLARILLLATKEKDIVIDSFLGSGTTAAVAHKMGRRWIGIELGDHAYTHCKVRMDKVVDGEQGGISKAVGWKGGGGYKFYELAPSLLEKHQELPIYTVNKFYTFEMLCEAICKLEGFRYHPEGEMHGNSSETRFIHIAKDYVSADYVMNLLKNMGEKDSVLIYGTKIQSRMRLPDSVVVKKIPKDLLDKCVFESEVR